MTMRNTYCAAVLPVINVYVVMGPGSRSGLIVMNLTNTHDTHAYTYYQRVGTVLYVICINQDLYNSLFSFSLNVNAQSPFFNLLQSLSLSRGMQELLVSIHQPYPLQSPSSNLLSTVSDISTQGFCCLSPASTLLGPLL